MTAPTLTPEETAGWFTVYSHAMGMLLIDPDGEAPEDAADEAVRLYRQRRGRQREMEPRAKSCAPACDDTGTVRLPDYSYPCPEHGRHGLDTSGAPDPHCDACGGYGEIHVMRAGEDTAEVKPCECMPVEPSGSESDCASCERLVGERDEAERALDDVLRLLGWEGDWSNRVGFADAVSIAEGCLQGSARAELDDAQARLAALTRAVERQLAVDERTARGSGEQARAARARIQPLRAALEKTSPSTPDNA